tara:strand:+ start:2049 stop:2768 length:720 start_codon:yes stop_codon:yes gene_type:complete
MQQGWKKAGFLFSAAAVFYAIGLFFEIYYYYILTDIFEDCWGDSGGGCHMLQQQKYHLIGGVLVAGTLAKISFDKDRRLNHPTGNIGLTKSYFFTSSGEMKIAATNLNVSEPTYDGWKNFGIAYALFFVNITISYEFFFSIPIHIALTIMYGFIYKGEFWKGFGRVFALCFVLSLLMLLSGFDEISIVFIFIAAGVFLGMIIHSHANGKHTRAIGLLYGLPIAFFGLMLFIVMMIFGSW